MALDDFLDLGNMSNAIGQQMLAAQQHAANQQRYGAQMGFYDQDWEEVQNRYAAAIAAQQAAAQTSRGIADRSYGVGVGAANRNYGVDASNASGRYAVGSQAAAGDYAVGAQGLEGRYGLQTAAAGQDYGLASQRAQHDYDLSSRGASEAYRLGSGSVETDYQRAIRDLAAQRARDAETFYSTYAQRGMGNSGIVGADAARYNTQYQNRYGDFGTDRAQALDQLGTRRDLALRGAGYGREDALMGAGNARDQALAAALFGRTQGLAELGQNRSATEAALAQARDAALANAAASRDNAYGAYGASRDNAYDSAALDTYQTGLTAELSRYGAQRQIDQNRIYTGYDMTNEDEQYRIAQAIRAQQQAAGLLA